MKTFLITLGCVVVLLIAVVIGGFYWVIGNMQRQIAAQETLITTPANYIAAGKDLALLCQSDPKWFTDDEPLRPAWAPASVLKLGCTWVNVTPQQASVEFGGGFHHFGYRLTRDATRSTPANNVWVLDFYSEDVANKTLSTFSLPADRKLSKAAVIQNAMAEYRSRIGTDPNCTNVRDRLEWLLDLDEPALAVASIREFAAKDPRDWLDVMLAYVMDADRDPNAAARLEQWASGMNDYTAWIFAAEAYSRTNANDAAERCVKRAVASGPDDPSWVQTHARHRGAPMCRILYANGRYATCEQLCDALLKYKDAGQDLAGPLTAIRDAARAARAGQPPPNPATLQIPDEFDPFEKIDLNALKSAARAATLPSASQPTGPN